jgi:CRP/FNR family transcriptional regulator, cyclic AMP receptor protein
MPCCHDPVRVVSEQAIFASLSIEECRALVGRSVCRSVQPGERLFREGDQCRGLYLVVEGAVRVYRANPDGQEQVLRLARPGDSLGEVAVFDEGPYLASARASGAARVLFLSFDEVRALYRRHPEVAQAVVRHLGQRVRELVSLVDRLALHDVLGRVAGAVLEYGATGDAARDGASFRLPRTQEELAAELGATRETVARALARLRRDGAIRQKGAQIELLDVGSLRTLAGSGHSVLPASRC